MSSERPLRPGELEELLAAFIERRERDGAADVEAFCAEHAAGGEVLRAAIEEMLAAEARLARSGPGRPARIGPYEIAELLGRGGAGRVYRARDAAGREFALKIAGEAALFDAQSRRRLRREYEILAGIDDPGIVRIHDFGEWRGLPYLVMERIDGQGLDEVVAEARSRGMAPAGALLAARRAEDPYRRTARLLAEIARATGVLHEHGLLHRDLKPANVRLRADGRPVLLDFGLARLPDASRLTRTGELLGTPAYMAPEQVRGRRADPRTDVWGLGALAHALLLLRPPYEGPDASAVLAAILARPVRPLRARAPAIPRALARIVDRALAHDPRWRQPDARALAAELARFAAGAPAGARRFVLARRLDESLRFHPARWALGAAALLAAGLLFFMPPRGSAAEARALVERAALAWLDGDHEAAAALGRRLAVLDAGHPLLPFFTGGPPPAGGAPADPAAALAAGAELLGRGRAQPALPLLASAVEGLPGQALPVALLALAERRAGDLDAAERELTAAIRMLPHSAVLLRELAAVHRARGRRAEAERLLGKACRLAPAQPRLWRERARILLELGRLDEGLQASARALALEGAHPSALTRSIHAALLSKAGRLDEARRLFAAVAEDLPESPRALYNLALTLDSSHRLAEAKQAYRKLVRLAPDDPRGRLALAWLASGSDRSCAGCRAAFAQDPSLFDAAEAETQLLEAVRRGAGRSAQDLQLAVVIAKRLGRRARLAALLARLAARPDLSDERLGRLTRALRALRD